MIARCTGVADVTAALQFGLAHELEIAVRGGGHNVAGKAVVDDGIVIDLSGMKGMRVDPVSRVAHAQAGLTWGEFDRETQAFGLATTGGEISSTGIAGLTLGGGIGYLQRKHGLTCDNLLSADVVTADGRLLTASETRNPDLFWGLRGGGGNFGIVTSFEYRLHPVGQVLAGPVLHPSAPRGRRSTSTATTRRRPPTRSPPYTPSPPSPMASGPSPSSSATAATPRWARSRLRPCAGSGARLRT